VNQSGVSGDDILSLAAGCPAVKKPGGRMKKFFRLLLPVATLLAAFFALNGVSFATKEMAKKEQKACNTCHGKGAPSKDNLNETGQFYKAKKTLEGAPAPKK
jgi:hypothetical protein